MFSKKTTKKLVCQKYMTSKWKTRKPDFNFVDFSNFISATGTRLCLTLMPQHKFADRCDNEDILLFFFA